MPATLLMPAISVGDGDRDVDGAKGKITVKKSESEVCGFLPSGFNPSSDFHLVSGLTQIPT